MGNWPNDIYEFGTWDGEISSGFDEDEKFYLISYVSKSDRWIIDSGCSNYMIGDRSKFEDIGPYKSGCDMFGNDVPCLVKGKG